METLKPVTVTESDSTCPLSYHTFCHILQALDMLKVVIDVFCHITAEDLGDSAIGFSEFTGEKSTTLSEVSLLHYVTYIH